MFNFLISDFEKETWLFLKGVTYKHFLILLSIPLVFGLLFFFLTSKHSALYLLSEYAGLLFFQPESEEKRNDPSKFSASSLSLPL